MNVIQCLACKDLLAPCMTETKFRKWCVCGDVEIQIIDPRSELFKQRRVEVKLSRNAKAQVVKINNGLFFENNSELDFDGDYLRGTLFAEHRSHIVIAPLDTPGVVVVKEFTPITKLQKINSWFFR